MTLNRLVFPAIALFLVAPGLSTVKASGQSQEQPLSVYEQNYMTWDTPPQDLQGVQLKGFRDGIVGASKDFDNSLRPNMKESEGYRNPHLPPSQREAYFDGFRLGYERGMSHFVGGPDQPVALFEGPTREPAPSGPEIAMGTDPGPRNEIQRRGFQDGMARARKDLGNHRRPDVNDRDEARRLKLPPDSRLQYLAAFTQGYDQFMSLRAGGPLGRP